MIASSGRYLFSSQKSRWGLIGSASCIARSSISFHQSSTSPSICSAMTARSCAATSGISSASVCLRVADEAELHRVADVQHAAVDVDLHAACLARLRQKLGVGKATSRP